MDSVVRLGPLVFALDRLVALAAIWAFMAMGTVIAARTGAAAGRAASIAAGVGLVAARAGYVAMNWPAFAIAPWTIMAFWQGGFAVWPGVTAAAIALIVLLKTSRAAMAASMMGQTCQSSGR